MNSPLQILGIAGSLRRQSYNRAALRVAQQIAPPELQVQIAEIGDLPLFNEDIEQPPPPPVVRLKNQIQAADAILLVTPEYNYSIPGVLKNAIDWASRPYGQSAWTGKPVAIMGASIGRLGSARAQYHLRQCFVFLDMHPLNDPEVMIANAADKFDQAGNLTDADTRDYIRKLLTALADWTRQLQT